MMQNLWAALAPRRRKPAVVIDGRSASVEKRDAAVLLELGADRDTLWDIGADLDRGPRS